MLLRRHTIFPPDQPLSCLLSAEQSPSGRPLAGEVRRIGLQGVSVLFPSLPPLETSRVDLVLLLGGSDCVCGCHLLEQRRIIVSRESRALELLLAFDGSDPGAMAPLYRYLESMEREMERAGIPEDERPLTADETSGSTSMSA
jgi:hypothetical protein